MVRVPAPVTPRLAADGDGLRCSSILFALRDFPHHVDVALPKNVEVIDLANHPNLRQLLSVGLPLAHVHVSLPTDCSVLSFNTSRARRATNATFNRGPEASETANNNSMNTWVGRNFRTDSHDGCEE